MKARIALIVVLLITIIPHVKATTTVVVIIAMDEEWANVQVGWLLGQAMAYYVVEVNGIAQVLDDYGIALNVEYVWYDSDDSISDCIARALEVDEEVPHEEKMLWGFTNQYLSQQGQAIPHRHVMIAQWTHPSSPLYTRLVLHEAGHLFNLRHCLNVCTMNPAYTFSRDVLYYCWSCQSELLYWKDHWMEIEAPVYVSGQKGGGPAGFPRFCKLR